MYVHIILILLCVVSLTISLRCHECSGNHCQGLGDLGNVTRCKSDVRRTLNFFFIPQYSFQTEFCVFSVEETYDKKNQSVCLNTI